MAINTVMVEKCEICGKRFELLSHLYMHKQSHTPNLLLHQHPHPAFGMDTKQVALREKGNDYLPVANTLQVQSKSSDDSDFEFSSYNKGRRLKRKRSSDDGEDGGPIVKRIREKEATNKSLKIKPYDRNDRRIKRGKAKKARIKGRKLKKVLDNDDEKGIDSSEEERDPGLRAVEIYSSDSEMENQREKQSNFREVKNLKNMLEDVREDCRDMIDDEKERCRDILLEVKNENKTLVDGLKESHKDDVTAIEKKCEEKLSEKDRVHKIEIDNLTERFEDGMKEKDKEKEAMEKDLKAKIEMLNKLLQKEQEDEDYLTPLARAIFNCTTMEEIFEIKNLIETYKVNELTQKHYNTLQNMFLSLAYGVLPICQPQWDTITDSQRELVGKIQNSSFNTVKGILNENRKEIANLFTIIEDSLKLARNSFNRYGVHEEGHKRSS